MMNQLPKWTRLLSSPKGQQAVAWTLIALCLLPFVALSCYNHPTLDDILDAETVRKIGFWQAQKFFYFSHTGRYTTTMLLGLINPLCYGKWAASWWWVTLVFVFGTVLVLRYGMGAVFGLPARAAWLMASLVLGLWLAYAPGLAEGLYWFTGAYTYIAAVWLLVAWLVALVRYAEARHKAGQHPRRRLLLVAVLTVAVAGTPEPLALPFVLLLLLGTGLSWWLERGRIITLLAVLALAGSAVSFLAPGNFVRMGTMGESFGVFKTFVYSGGATAYLLFTWVSNPVLLALSALLLPALYRVGQQREHLVVRLLAHMPPGALALVLAGLMAAAGCPAYYASGTGLPLRARTMLYLVFLLGWFGTLLAWCCRQTVRQQAGPALKSWLATPATALWMGLVVLFFFADYNVQTRASMVGQGSNNVLRAYRQWLSGDAAGYDAEQRARYQTLAAGSPAAPIAPLHHRPDLLVSFDIAENINPALLQQYRHHLAGHR